MKVGDLFKERVRSADDIRREMLADAKGAFGHIQRTDEEYLAIMASCYKHQRDEARAALERAGLW